MMTSFQGEIMDLDLNQDPSSGSESQELFPWLNELESSQDQVEERLRQIKDIVTRIRERETTTKPTLIQPNEHTDSTVGVIHERHRERLVENGGDKTYLIAKALNMEKTNSIAGGFFDCNICIQKAKDPILTCCGHLFCWGCFYQLPVVYLNIRECPVCEGEVTEMEVIPIYGNADDSDHTKSKLKDCGISLPPRPNAKRVDSVRQRIINQSVPFFPGHSHETIEHTRAIDSIGLQALAQGNEFGLTNIINNGPDNVVQQQQHPHHNPYPPFGHYGVLLPSAPFPGFVVDTPIMPAVFDVDSFVDTTSLRRNRRRPSPGVRASFQRNRSNNASQAISIRFGPPGEFAFPSSSIATRSQTLDPTEVVTSGTATSSSRRRTDDVNNGPWTRSRRRLR